MSDIALTFAILGGLLAFGALMSGDAWRGACALWRATRRRIALTLGIAAVCALALACGDSAPIQRIDSPLDGFTPAEWNALPCAERLDRMAAVYGPAVYQHLTCLDAEREAAYAERSASQACLWYEGSWRVVDRFPPHGATLAIGGCHEYHLAYTGATGR